MKKDDAPRAVAEIRFLAKEAEAEAAKAEARAAAARAHVRAIRSRREARSRRAAELVGAMNDVGKADSTTEMLAQVDAKKRAGTKRAAVADTVAAKVTDSTKAKFRGTRHAREPDEDDDYLKDQDAESGAVVALDSDAVKDDKEQAANATPGWRGLSRLRSQILNTAAAVLAIGVVLFALGASVEMSVLHRNATRERQQVNEFAAAARQVVVTLTSLDFEHAKEAVQRILEVSTGTFKDDFLKQADDFTKVVEASKVVSLGSVQAAAVDLTTVTDNSAVVFVASTSEVTNAAGAKQEPRKYRVAVTLTRESGQLKMSKVEFVL